VLNGSIPWVIGFSGGLSRLDADLSRLRLDSLSASSGVSRVKLLLTEPSGKVSIRFDGGISDVTGRCPKGAAVAYWRRSRDGCAKCGRTDAGSGCCPPGAAARWGRWATYFAVIGPLPYAAVRWAWALGIPLGITEKFFREGQETGLWWAGTALSMVDLAGAFLTLGLVQHWGEVFPRWVLLLSGKRVPPVMAIVPASLVSVMVTSARLQVVRGFLVNGFPTEGWATTAPGLLWPVWGVALGAGTLAYYYRRRGRCARCGRGEDYHSLDA